MDSSISNLLVLPVLITIASCAPQTIITPPRLVQPVQTQTVAVTPVPIAISSAPHLFQVAAVPARVATITGSPLAAITQPPRLDEQYDPNPQYRFTYSVNDQTTGDIKSQTETRNGDRVQGTYSLIEPDGSLRRVDYTADSVNGFNAAVHKEAGVHQRPTAAVPVTIVRPASAPPPLAFAVALPQTVLQPHQFHTFTHPVGTVLQSPVAIRPQIVPQRILQ